MKHQRNHGPAELDVAMQHHRAGRLQQAEAIYKKMPGHPDALHLLGVISHQMNKDDEAAALINKAIAASPANASYYFSIDPVYRALGKLDELVAGYQNLLAHRPNEANIHNNLANALKDQGKLDEAAACYLNAITLKPDFAEAHSNLGAVFAAQGKLDQAVNHYRKAVAIKPDFAGAHINLGVALKDLGKPDQAVLHYQKALALKPDFAEAHINLGIAFKEQGKLDDAVACYQKAIALKPDFADTYTHLGIALSEQGRLDDAVACYEQALALNPDDATAYNNLAGGFRAQGNLDAAVTCYLNALELNPNLVEAHYNLGATLREQGKRSEAVTCYLNALALKPDFAEAYNTLGIVFSDLGNLDEAISFYQTAITLKPDLPDAYTNLGISAKEKGNLDDAAVYCQKALDLKPDFAEAHGNLGAVYHAQGSPDEAIRSYRQALAYRPNFAAAHHSLLLSMQYSATHTPEEVFAEHVRFGTQFETPLKPHWGPHQNARDPHKRLKIGYVSPDFYHHAVAYFVEPMLGCHDRSRVEIFCYYNRTTRDYITDRIEALADHWIPCKDMSDDQLAAQIRADGIDILVDLAGHTGSSRLLAFAKKPAPVQVTYLGHPATSGMTAMDYRLTDIHAEPPGMTEQFNVEQLWRLPEMFCCYRPNDNSPDVIGHPPAEDNGYVTFGCFNNFSKVTDQVIALWAKVLDKVTASRLMLEINGIDNPVFRSETESRFAKLGIPVERLILIPRKKGNQYVLYNRIDVALDPFPCNGGTTSLDTVWMGVPFVTLAGKHFSSRLGVTVLTNAGLPELIAHSEDDYLNIATALALDYARLKTIRAGLRERVKVSPLMDAPRFTAHLEQAYRGMWQNWCGREPGEFQEGGLA